MSNLVFVPCVSIEISEEDHWDEFGKYYYPSHKDALDAAAALVEDFKVNCPNARFTYCVISFSPGFLTSNDPI